MWEMMAFLQLSFLCRYISSEDFTWDVRNGDFSVRENNYLDEKMRILALAVVSFCYKNNSC